MLVSRERSCDCSVGPRYSISGSHPCSDDEHPGLKSHYPSETGPSSPLTMLHPQQQPEPPLRAATASAHLAQSETLRRTYLQGLPRSRPSSSCSALAYQPATRALPIAHRSDAVRPLRGSIPCGACTVASRDLSSSSCGRLPHRTRAGVDAEAQAIWGAGLASGSTVAWTVWRDMRPFACPGSREA